MRLTITLLLALAAGVAHADDEEAPNGFFGVTISDVGKLLVVSSVYKGTSAEKYGARPGDLIVAINGEAPKSTQAMIAKVTSKKVGTPFRFRLLRGDREFDVDVKLGKRPDPMIDIDFEPTARDAKRLTFLRGVQSTPDPLKAVLANAMARLRKGDDQVDARGMLAIYRAMVEAEHTLAKKGEKRKWAPELARAFWLLTLARADAHIPENNGRVARDDAALRRRIDAALDQLGDPRWAAREAACAALFAIGEPAMKPAAERARSAEDPEVAWRAGQVSTAIARRLAVGDVDWTPSVSEVLTIEGAALTTRGVVGPEMAAGAPYTGIVLRPGKTKGSWRKAGTVELRATGGRSATLKKGTLKKGDRLGYLAPQPKKPATDKPAAPTR